MLGIDGKGILLSILPPELYMSGLTCCTTNNKMPQKMRQTAIKYYIAQ